MKKERERKIIGRTERVELPVWDFSDIEAKIDTGAYTSSLHSHKVVQIEKAGEPWLRFSLLDPEHGAYSEQQLEAPLLDIRDVKSSNGITEQRYIVKTDILFFGEKYSIELSLADRSSMKFPLLIGRKFIQKTGFLVDVNRKNLSSKMSRKESS